MCGRISRLILRAYKVQTAELYTSITKLVFTAGPVQNCKRLSALISSNWISVVSDVKKSKILLEF